VPKAFTRFRGGTREALGGELIGDEPVAELGVVVMDIDRGIAGALVLQRACT
jgi:hypothetical protein